MTRKIIAVTGLGTTSVIVLIILLFSSLYLYHIGIERKSQAVYSHNRQLVAKVEQKEQGQAFSIMAVADKSDYATLEHIPINWVENQYYETWTVTSFDGLNLVGYFFPAKTKTDRTVILAHGYGGQGLEMGRFAEFYAERLGYNVLLPDARGHGASEGSYIGFGWPDRLDYLLWIEQVITRTGSDAQIALHGLSMGGALVMMTSGESLPDQVKVIVEDSGYTSVYDVLSHQLKRAYNLPAFPLISAASMLTEIRAGYNFTEASSIKQVEKNKTPMLFIHGALDTLVPVEMVWKLYDASQAAKQLYIATAAGHGMAYDVDRPTYENIVTDFIGQYIDNKSELYCY